MPEAPRRSVVLLVLLSILLSFSARYAGAESPGTAPGPDTAPSPATIPEYYLQLRRDVLTELKLTPEQQKRRDEVSASIEKQMAGAKKEPPRTLRPLYAETIYKDGLTKIYQHARPQCPGDLTMDVAAVNCMLRVMGNIVDPTGKAASRCQVQAVAQPTLAETLLGCVVAGTEMKLFRSSFGAPDLATDWIPADEQRARDFAAKMMWRFTEICIRDDELHLAPCILLKFSLMAQTPPQELNYCRRQVGLVRQALCMIYKHEAYFIGQAAGRI